MARDNIKELQNLLDGHLNPDEEILKSEISRLTAPGENYGSVMLKLDITLRNKRNGTEEKLYTVAKKIPESEVMQAMFNIQVTYKNEVGWYAEIAPTLREFQKQLGINRTIDCSPKFYAARFNLDGGSQVDDDATLILENLHVSGYVNIDRLEGFDLDTTKLVLRSLAEFHAVPLALKLKHPQVFEEKIKTHCTRYRLTEDDKVYDYLIFQILEEVDKFKPLIPKIHKYFDQRTKAPREPFATVAHNDVWTNNTMQKFQNGIPVANKFVDFQLLSYDSPAADLFFFLFTSVQQEVLATYLDYLIEYYHEHFVAILQRHQCDLAPFGFAAFAEELALEAEYELAHAMILAVITVNAKKGSKLKLDEQPSVELLMESVTEQAKRRVWYIAETCMERGWVSQTNPDTMSEDNVRNLQDLLGEYLGPNKEVIKSEISRLTGPGENYGSVMLKLDITLKCKDDGQKEILHAVAKKLPEGEVMRTIFNVQVTYKNEVGLYANIIPLLRNFQQEMGVAWSIDCTPAIYGSRFNLDGGSKVDDDAALVLENLHVSGYKNIDRIVGFDLETTKVVLRSLAEFHAVPLALKLKNPQLFEEKIKIFCTGYQLVEDDKIYDYVVIEIMKQNEKLKSFVTKVRKFFDQRTSAPREPFATIAHNDIWTNNTMQKFDGDKPVANKFVDFQLMGYESPAADLFFYLFTSVQQSVLESHLDYLIKYYHDHLINILKEHQCDVAPFAFDIFQNEIKLDAEYELAHAMVFAVVAVNAKKGSKIKFDEQPTLESLMQSVTDQAKQRVWYIAETCMERGWY